MYGSTSAAMNLFRAIGGSLSVSVLGAVLVSRAKSELVRQLGVRAQGIDLARLINGGGLGTSHHSEAVGTALLGGLHSIHIIAAIVALAGVGFALALEERPLSTSVAGG
jgi:hypothetical protein